MSRKITIYIDSDTKKIKISGDSNSAIYDGSTPSDITYALECYLEDYCEEDEPCLKQSV
jgi:hypothetical protein